jgi:serine/threonine-protein kinase
MDRHRPGRETYSTLRKEVSPWSDLFGAGVVALDLFTNWIENEEHFRRPWQEVFPGNDPLKTFIAKLLIPEEQFSSARAAFDHLGGPWRCPSAGIADSQPTLTCLNIHSDTVDIL